MILSSDIPISATAEGIMKLAVKREENTKYTYRMLSSISDLDIRIKKVFKNIPDNGTREKDKKTGRMGLSKEFIFWLHINCLSITRTFNILKKWIYL